VPLAARGLPKESRAVVVRFLLHEM
jgi:hypothetical protein